MDNTVRKSIGALMLLIAVYFGYQRALSAELKGHVGHRFDSFWCWWCISNN